MDLYEFLNFYLDGRIQCQIYDPSLDYEDSILFEGTVYDAIKKFKNSSYSLTSTIEIDNTGILYLPVE